MKIAVASQNKTSIADHTGQCQNFWIYEVNATEILGKELLELPQGQSFHDTCRNDPHSLDNVGILIAKTIGQGLRTKLEQRSIEGIATPESDPDRAVRAYLDGSLVKAAPTANESECEHYAAGSA